MILSGRLYKHVGSIGAPSGNRTSNNKEEKEQRTNMRNLGAGNALEIAKHSTAVLNSSLRINVERQHQYTQTMKMDFESPGIYHRGARC